MIYILASIFWNTVYMYKSVDRTHTHTQMRDGGHGCVRCPSSSSSMISTRNDVIYSLGGVMEVAARRLTMELFTRVCHAVPSVRSPSERRPEQSAIIRYRYSGVTAAAEHATVGDGLRRPRGRLSQTGFKDVRLLDVSFIDPVTKSLTSVTQRTRQRITDRLLRRCVRTSQLAMQL